MATAAEPHGFTHAAFLYAGDEEFLDGTLSFIREGLTAGEPVLAVLDTRKIELLREGLNGEVDRVLFADMSEVGANPARIIPAWEDFVAEHHRDGRQVRGIGEPICPERSPDELVECHRHESLLNVAFADAPFTLMCPYDVDALDDDAIEEAMRTHPYIWRGEARGPSWSYAGLGTITEPFDAALTPPPPSAEELVVDRESLLAARRVVADRAAEAELGSERASDLVLAVNEVLTNSVRHGGGTGRLRIWEDAGELVCEVADSGQIADPLVDRRRPLPEQLRGRGLWMANQLCDLMQVRTFPGGNTIRLHMRRDL
ncbi:MAG TPA: sensor histidine kinase [Gaiellaceae bacterium]|nr:sensor histidine kinase [Gaiellaceae bacterium]